VLWISNSDFALPDFEPACRQAYGSSGLQRRVGLALTELEGHRARAAIAGLDGKSFEGNFLKVKYEEPRKGQKGRHHRGLTLMAVIDSRH